MDSIAKLIAYIMFLITGSLLSPGPNLPAASSVLSGATASAVIRKAPASAMATPGQLLPAINAYRTSRGLSSLSGSGTLCTIAQSRANDQQSAGHLDHSGFVAAAYSQTEFQHVGEILQYWDVPEDATYLVEKGWSQSGEHNAIMLDPAWTNGCGGISGFYSVFIFGRH